MSQRLLGFDPATGKLPGRTELRLSRVADVQQEHASTRFEHNQPDDVAFDGGDHAHAHPMCHAATLST
jgi:hypothetical protein